jgi:hypothetical protein
VNIPIVHDKFANDPFADLEACRLELEQLGKLCSEGLDSADPRVSFLAMVVIIYHCVEILLQNERRTS